MLFRTRDKVSGKTLVRSSPLLTQPMAGYVRPRTEGRAWFDTTTNVWRVDELMKRRVRDWRRLMGETGHSGERTGTMRADHDSVYTGTHSIFAAPLMEYIVLRYAGKPGSKVLDAFAGGPPRGVVTGIMGHEYHGVEIRKEQINENNGIVRKLGLNGVNYHLADGRYLDQCGGDYDCAITCPPYYDLEQYSDLPEDLSNAGSYEEFRAGIWMSARAHKPLMKPGAFVCWVVGNFRGKGGELIDFRSHVVEDFRHAGFLFWQEVILTKNFASAAVRAANAWRGHKLVPIFESLLVFRNPT